MMMKKFIIVLAGLLFVGMSTAQVLAPQDDLAESNNLRHNDGPTASASDVTGSAATMGGAASGSATGAATGAATGPTGLPTGPTGLPTGTATGSATGVTGAALPTPEFSHRPANPPRGKAFIIVTLRIRGMTPDLAQAKSGLIIEALSSALGSTVLPGDIALEAVLSVSEYEARHSSDGDIAVSFLELGTQSASEMAFVQLRLTVDERDADTLARQVHTVVADGNGLPEAMRSVGLQQAEVSLAAAPRIITNDEPKPGHTGDASTTAVSGLMTIVAVTIAGLTMRML